MKKGLRISAGFIAAIVLTSCAGDRSHKVSSMQRKDKTLSCKEIKLEMNEAEMYRTTAEKNKDPKLKSILMPLGYISTYVNAEDAIGAATARVDYLNRIYEILDCDNPKAQANVSATQPRFQPQGYYVPQMLAPTQYPVGAQQMYYNNYQAPQQQAAEWYY